MESSSDAPLSPSARFEDYEYLYAINTNVSNFVSVKLSADGRNYLIWRAQMFCLLDSYKIRGIVDYKFDGPRDIRKEAMSEYQNLVKGWILGSVSEDVHGDVYNPDLEYAKKVFNHGSAKYVWERLKSMYDSTASSQQAEKLSGNGQNYRQWEQQMRDLLVKHSMYEVVDSTYVGPRQKDSLVKGWIFDSVNEDVLKDVYNLDSAKAVCDKLKSKHDSPTFLQQAGSAPTKTDAQTEIKDIVHADSAETNTAGSGECSILDIMEGSVPTKTDAQTETKDIHADSAETNTADKDTTSINIKDLRKATEKGDLLEVDFILQNHKDLATHAIKDDDSTTLHIAVGMGDFELVRYLLRRYYNDTKEVLKPRKDGSTVLHIAALVGNQDVAKLLVEKNSELLKIEDKEDKQPLQRAYENMHLDVTAYLLKAGAPKKDERSSTHPDLPADQLSIGVNLLANAISAGRYDLASELVMYFPVFASKNDHVLMAIARNFPQELNRVESLVYPASLDNIWSSIKDAATHILHIVLFLLFFPLVAYVMVWHEEESTGDMISMTGLAILLLPLAFAKFHICVTYFLFLLPYYPLWKAANKLHVPLVTHIENKKRKLDEATHVLQSVCIEVDKLSLYDRYTRPILEAACQNAYKVVDEIMTRSPDAIQSTNESGYDIIQIAIMNRSEKIYNLIYDLPEHVNLYGRPIDSSKNNILHLAGRLAPSCKLNYRTGAALQLQQELQWFEEVKKLVFPTHITQENIFKETPDMVFTREHKNLLKEAEQWMKTTAESCSITAALITTIVFAAAITVPGGNNQEKGTPLFREEYAFTIFAISIAISLFASSTALLVFLSILTARFAEKDFRSSLPRRLLIGLFTLLLSTTAMMVAFSATLFLVFCDKKPWMLAPICGLAFIPIAVFVMLQFPLMVDIFRSTNIRAFGKQGRSVIRRFNPNHIKLILQKRS